MGDDHSLFEENEKLKGEIKSLRGRLSEEDKEISASREKLRIAHEAAIQALVRAIESKDPFKKGHYDFVSKYAVVTGRKLGLEAGSLNRLRIGGLLMDIGNVAVDNSLLAKADPLSEREEGIIRSHVRIGAQILDPITSPWEIGTLVYQHHERYDGSGYPEGLKGEEILIEARILGLCDSFVAMVGPRAFRDAYSRTFTFTTIGEESGNKFDPEVVEAFIDEAKRDDSEMMADFSELFDKT